ncbi:MAG: hypothetical protein QM811_10050 [Pirellulales bacterium]
MNVSDFRFAFLRFAVFVGAMAIDLGVDGRTDTVLATTFAAGNGCATVGRIENGTGPGIMGRFIDTTPKSNDGERKLGDSPYLSS